MVFKNDYGARQKSDDFKNQKENGRRGRKEWYLKTIRIGSTGAINADFGKQKGSRRTGDNWRTGEKVKYWKTIILAADTAENARFGKRQERG